METRRLQTFVLLALSWACVRTAAADPAAKPAEPSLLAASVTDIDIFCDRLAQIGETKRHHLFATISKDGGSAPWREYSTDRELQVRLKTLGTYTVAEFWKREDVAVFVKTTASSDTGDWSKVTRYCFRPDGSLARTKFVTMNSTVDEGGFVGTRIQHFAPDGHLINATSELRNLETDKKLDHGDFDGGELIYKTVSVLPFMGLLKTLR
jgi:hypothetical protein